MTFMRLVSHAIAVTFTRPFERSDYGVLAPISIDFAGLLIINKIQTKSVSRPHNFNLDRCVCIFPDPHNT